MCRKTNRRGGVVAPSGKHLVSGDFTFDLRKNQNSERLIVSLKKFVYGQIFLNAFRLIQHSESTIKYFLVFLNWRFK